MTPQYFRDQITAFRYMADGIAKRTRLAVFHSKIEWALANGQRGNQLLKAINYACDEAEDPIYWLRDWREGDVGALSDLEKWSKGSEIVVKKGLQTGE